MITKPAEGSITTTWPALSSLSTFVLSLTKIRRTLRIYSALPISYFLTSAFRAKFNAGEIVITAEDLPSLLFSDDVVYDEQNPVAGLGTGHVFLRVRFNHCLGS
jgi:hypothetical protein